MLKFRLDCSLGFSGLAAVLLTGTIVAFLVSLLVILYFVVFQ